MSNNPNPNTNQSTIMGCVVWALGLTLAFLIFSLSIAVWVNWIF